MNEETRIKLRETRRQMMADLESSMLKGKSPEDMDYWEEGLTPPEGSEARIAPFA